MTVHEIIMNAIGKGEQEAVHLAKIVQLSELSDRDARRVIEDLRKRGVVICSNEHGYFKPATLSELQSYCRQEQARTLSIYKRTASARKLLKKWREQQEFEKETLLGGDGNV